MITLYDAVAHLHKQDATLDGNWIYKVLQRACRAYYVRPEGAPITHKMLTCLRQGAGRRVSYLVHIESVTQFLQERKETITARKSQKADSVHHIICQLGQEKHYHAATNACIAYQMARNTTTPLTTRMLPCQPAIAGRMRYYSTTVADVEQWLKHNFPA